VIVSDQWLVKPVLGLVVLGGKESGIVSDKIWSC